MTLSDLEWFDRMVTMTEFGTVTKVGRSIFLEGQPRTHRKGAPAAYDHFPWRLSAKFYAEVTTDLCCIYLFYLVYLFIWSQNNNQNSDKSSSTWAKQKANKLAFTVAHINVIDSYK